MPARSGKRRMGNMAAPTGEVSTIHRLMLEAFAAKAAAAAAAATADTFLDTLLAGKPVSEDTSPSLATSSPSATQPSTRGASSNAALSDAPVSLSPPSQTRRPITPLSERLRRFSVKNGLMVGRTAFSPKASGSAGSAEVPPLLPVPVPVPALESGAATPPVSVSPQPCIPSPPDDGLPGLISLDDGTVAEAASAPAESSLPELIAPSGRNPHEGARQTMTHDPYSPVGFVLQESQGCGTLRAASDPGHADHVLDAEALSGGGTEKALEEPDRASLQASHGVVPCFPGSDMFSAQAFGAGQMFEGEAGDVYASKVASMYSLNSSWAEKEAGRTAMLYQESIVRSMLLQNLQFVYRCGAAAGCGSVG